VEKKEEEESRGGRKGMKYNYRCMNIMKKENKRSVINKQNMSLRNVHQKRKNNNSPRIPSLKTNKTNKKKESM
jgi:hypothetical protein